MLLQQQQFQEAMRIQMAMKQMPLDGIDALGGHIGLRQKNLGGGVPPPSHLMNSAPFEEKLSQQE